MELKIDIMRMFKIKRNERKLNGRKIRKNEREREREF